MDSAVVTDEEPGGRVSAIALCIGCGQPLETVLERLGSLRCHDCRENGGFDPLERRVFGR
jgi:hypothetical protein